MRKYWSLWSYRNFSRFHHLTVCVFFILLFALYFSRFLHHFVRVFRVFTILLLAFVSRFYHPCSRFSRFLYPTVRVFLIVLTVRVFFILQFAFFSHFFFSFSCSRFYHPSAYCSPFLITIYHYCTFLKKNLSAFFSLHCRVFQWRNTVFYSSSYRRFVIIILSL